MPSHYLWLQRLSVWIDELDRLSSACVRLKSRVFVACSRAAGRSLSLWRQALQSSGLARGVSGADTDPLTHPPRP
jgi:hypothetical protein